MKKMSISHLSIFVLALVVLGLSGCSSNKKKTQEANANAASETATDAQLGALQKLGDSDSGKAGELKTVNFAYDSSAISDEARSILENNANFMKKMENVKVRVEGHCDERGSQQYNIALGNRRAQAVKKFLEGLGVASDRIETYSYGKERPLTFDHTETSWAQNRRGNFVVTEL